MIDRILAKLIGCAHSRLSRVFTNRTSHFSYQTCLDCGQAWSYSWARMKRGRALAAQREFVTWESAQGATNEVEG